MSLDEIRKNTCYGGLRAAISLIFYLLVSVSILTALLQARLLGGGAGFLAGLLVASVGVAITWCLLWLARELLFVLIDIADALVAGYARESR